MNWISDINQLEKDLNIYSMVVELCVEWIKKEGINDEQ